MSNGDAAYYLMILGFLVMTISSILTFAGADETIRGVGSLLLGASITAWHAGLVFLGRHIQEKKA